MPISADFFSSKKPIIPEKIPVRSLLSDSCKRLHLYSLNGEIGLDNPIVEAPIHRPQLALAGYVDLFTHHRVQIFGNTEIFYLQSLPKDVRLKAFAGICEFPMPVIIITNDHPVEDDMIRIASERGISMLRTKEETITILRYLSEYLENQFAPQLSVHASLVDVYGVGIMFIGQSGIGKSEIALDLVERGHRLVADDVVTLTRKYDDIIIGTGNKVAQHFMEIRGLGFIDIRHMFGVRAIRYQKRVEVIVELEIWDNDTEYTRTGLDRDTISILGTAIDFVRLPILPGKNITVIAEVIALNYLSRMYGYDAAQAFAKRLESQIAENARRAKGTENLRNFLTFENDLE